MEKSKLTPEQKKAKIASTNAWQLKNVRRYAVVLNVHTDADIIDFIARQPSANGAIKKALRHYMKKAEE